ncbi:glutamate racemase [Sulfobacillus thermosulfidooxidans]|uniref:glutamate racemase n=1 Tax=Sulfobacillus thermosulfidooxidans TaxID=28034 RepID=UPI001FA8BD2A|nr:glutamate racemase [Sulfobacillus thermosulfidooxidans]
MSVANRPIAVFDSGEGGLTVLRRAWALYPGEHFIYGADSDHFPYGSRSLDEVRDLFLRFLDFFIKQEVKAVVIACNTATAAALDIARAKSPVPVIGVVQPGAEKAVHTSASGRIGILSTYATYKSEVYRKAIEQYSHKAQVVQWPCPVLVTMAESGQTETEQARMAVRECLNTVFRHQVDTVVLGCTHFPHMERIFYEEVGNRAVIVDPGYETAKHLQDVLGPLRASSGGSLTFYTTGSTTEFNRISSVLWPHMDIQAQKLIWSSKGYEVYRKD